MPGQSVTLNGRTYLVDYGSSLYKRSSIPLLRTQSDSSERPGAQSLNPQGPWRRTFDTWHHGADQTHADRDGSDPNRFDTSTSADVWDEWQVKALHDVTLARAGQHIELFVIGGYVFAVDNTNALFVSSDPASGTWSPITGLPGAGVSGKLASDGTYLYIPTGLDLYRMTLGTTVAAVYNVTNATDAYYVKGRVIVTTGVEIYDITGAATQTLLHTLSTGAWVDVTAAGQNIYAASSSGGQGTVYRIGVLADGSGLDVAIEAGALPTGEDAYSIFGYAGYLLIGTDRGVRFCGIASNGDLVLGSLRDANTTTGVYGFTAEGPYVWYTNTSNAGLGRLDLSAFIRDLTPAGATDLTAGGAAATVRAAETFDGKRMFIVSAGASAGVYIEATTYESSATLTSGIIDYGLAEPKIPLYLDVQTEPLVASTSVALAVSVNGGSFTTVGTHDVDGATAFTADLSALGSTECRYFQVRVTLTSTASDSPIVTRLTLRAYPVTSRGEDIQLPIILSEQVIVDTVESYVDISAELAAISALVSANELVDLVEGDITTPVYVEDFQFNAHHATEDGNDQNGLLVLKMKSFTP